MNTTGEFLAIQSAQVALALWVSVLVFAIGAPTVAKAAEDTAYFVEEGNWPPFTPEYYGKTTEGLSYELITLVFDQLNMNVELELFPQKRALSMVERGRADGMTIISKNSARKKFLHFSEPVFQKRGLVYFLSDRLVDFSWSSYDDLVGLRIGTVLGHNYGDEFESAVERLNLKVEPVNSEEINFKKLLAGRVDLAFSVEMVAARVIASLDQDGQIQSATRPYYSKNYHVGISQKSELAKRLPDINSAIEKLVRSGELKALIDKYLMH